MRRSFCTQGYGRTLCVLSIMVVLVLTLTPGTNAAAEGAVVTIERLAGISVGITIHFPTEISGSFAGTMNGKHFDCDTIPPDSLYCVGPFPYWAGGAVLHIYSQSSGEVIFSRLLLPPPDGRPDRGTPKGST